MPDYMLIDLALSDPNTFDQAVETAKAVKQMPDSAGVPSFCKTRATGLHIYVPVGAKYSYGQVNQFAEIIAMRTVAMLPGFTSLKLRKGVALCPPCISDGKR